MSLCGEWSIWARLGQADLNLQPLNSSACWTAQLLSAFQGLRGRELYVQAVQTGHAIPMEEFTADLKQRMIGVWRHAELVAPSIFFFFFWWGLLHGPQQGPDRMKEKNL